MNTRFYTLVVTLLLIQVIYAFAASPRNTFDLRESPNQEDTAFNAAAAVRTDSGSANNPHNFQGRPKQKLHVVSDDLATLRRQPSIHEEDIRRLKQQEEFYQEHKGHEEMHAEIVMILMGVLILTQVVMLFWRRYHTKSFNRFTLFGLWIIPFILSVRSSFIRFIIIWTVFSILNSIVLYRAWQQPLSIGTPRAVYKWYYIVYHSCYTIGIIGYFTLLIEIFGFSRIFGHAFELFEIGTLLVFYGLYFGILGRDFADLCSDRMATTLGFYSKDGIPSRAFNPGMCAICCTPLNDSDSISSSTLPSLSSLFSPSTPVAHVHGSSSPPSTAVESSRVLEKTIKLECSHIFHEWCIRGWCIIGKKNICPFCKEKVDLKSLSTTPWETANMMHAGILDMLRYLIVWNPVMLIVFKTIIYFLDLR